MELVSLLLTARTWSTTRAPQASTASRPGSAAARGSSPTRSTSGSSPGLVFYTNPNPAERLDSRAQLHQRGPHLVLHVQRLASGGVGGAGRDLVHGDRGEVDVRVLERALVQHAAAHELDLADL